MSRQPITIEREEIFTSITLRERAARGYVFLTAHHLHVFKGADSRTHQQRHIPQRRLLPNTILHARNPRRKPP